MRCDKYLKVAVEAAVRAGKYARSRVGKIRDVSYKGDINIVTDVDKRSEDIIVKHIRKHYPTHGILSEEKYSKEVPSEFRWIIDPIDGTTNYFRRLPVYGVSIGLEVNGVTEAGVVYDPSNDNIYWAARGQGARLNKKRIYVAPTRKLKSAFLVTGFAYNIKDAANDNLGYFKSFLKTTLAVRRLGAASIDLCYVASGIFDGFWEMNLQPWDAAAGALLVEEAGGKVTTFNGSSYTPYKKQILATNRAIHSKMVKILKNPSC